MRNLIIILVFISLALSGCTQSSSDSSISSKRINQGTSVYLLGKNVVEFALYANMMNTVGPGESGESKSGSFSSQNAGSRIYWSADSTSIKISEYEYSFAKGRVFLISGNNRRNLEIQQLDIPVGKFESISDEVERLKKNPQIKNFHYKNTDNT